MMFLKNDNYGCYYKFLTYVFSTFLMMGLLVVPLANAEVQIEDLEKTFSKYYEQEITWIDCEEEKKKRFRCGQINVPIDWSDPTSDSIAIVFQMRLADNQKKKKGVLFINPGGPGGSGYDVVGIVEFLFTKKIAKFYDIVGFDPRGVERSAPVDCFSAEEHGKYLDGTEFDELRNQMGDGITTELVIARKASQEMFDMCFDKTGELIKNISTLDVVKDLDILREVFDEEVLHYIGMSYGTKIGAIYSQVFSEKSGKLILDGVTPVTLNSFEVAKTQIAGFERALKSFLDFCYEQSECLLHPDGKEAAYQRLIEIRDELDRNPRTYITDKGVERVVNATVFLYAVASAMYAKPFWAILHNALASYIIKDDVSSILEMADSYFRRDFETGDVMSNMFEALVAVNCSDYSEERKEDSVLIDNEEKIREQHPFFGALNDFGGDLGCQPWVKFREGKPVAPQVYDAKHKNPILVIGTTGDPATPIEWAKDTAAELDNTRLLVFDGEGHVALAQGSKCVVKKVYRYLVKNRVPKDGTICKQRNS